MENYNTYVQDEGREIQEGYVISADKVDEYSSGNYILLPEGDYNFTIVDLRVSRHADTGGKVGSCKQINPVFRIIDPETGSPVDISNHNLYMWDSVGCQRMMTQYFKSIFAIDKGKDLIIDFRKEKHIGQTGKLRIKHEKYTKKDGSEGTSMKISKLYPKEEPSPRPGTSGTGNWGWNK